VIAHCVVRCVVTCHRDCWLLLVWPFFKLRITGFFIAFRFMEGRVQIVGGNLGKCFAFTSSGNEVRILRCQTDTTTEVAVQRLNFGIWVIVAKVQVNVKDLGERDLSGILRVLHNVSTSIS